MPGPLANIIPYVAFVVSAENTDELTEVVALPDNEPENVLAVIVFAAKFPEASRATSELFVFVDVLLSVNVGLPRTPLPSVMLSPVLPDAITILRGVIVFVPV